MDIDLEHYINKPESIDPAENIEKKLQGISMSIIGGGATGLFANLYDAPPESLLLVLPGMGLGFVLFTTSISMDRREEGSIETVKSYLTNLTAFIGSYLASYVI
jgi:hypothetical protein